MDASEVIREEQTGLGAIRIADDVVKVIAGLAAIEIKGVAGMSGGLAGGIAELLGKKNLSKGIKVEVGEKETAIDIHVIMDYGIRIPDVAANIQSSVKDAVERMTGLAVVEVNVNVQGVAFASDPKEEEHRLR
ncbi:Asp23/Gls24 family envelope stress response protein [Pelotomaculum isophthalicicum JI]|uniref:Asp23/Gls24 family envelope stress response protein n=1 Tax=Pelotomaculum isophthalicicum JI TaxID=947010 RepID=A0A9X4H2R3_9FIRM|nr:Asp23/Gls24 family envelope stress response protein [Pelotomaculum isophthalicicum]MDF9407488.1 Asp23/Gls24 family envelope stress response protein [Pelotomaculum isophthalicicum JI]